MLNNQVYTQKNKKKQHKKNEAQKRNPKKGNNQFLSTKKPTILYYL